MNSSTKAGGACKPSLVSRSATSGGPVKASRSAAISHARDHFAGITSPAALDEAVAAKAGELAGRPPLVTGGSMVAAVAAICGRLQP